MRDTVYIPEFSQFEDCLKKWWGDGIGESRMRVYTPGNIRGPFHASWRLCLTAWGWGWNFLHFLNWGHRGSEHRAISSAQWLLEGKAVSLCHRTNHVPTCWGRRGDLSYAVFKTLCMLFDWSLTTLAEGSGARLSWDESWGRWRRVCRVGVWDWTESKAIENLPQGEESLVSWLCVIYK